MEHIGVEEGTRQPGRQWKSSLTSFKPCVWSMNKTTYLPVWEYWLNMEQEILHQRENELVIAKKCRPKTWICGHKKKQVQ